MMSKEVQGNNLNITMHIFYAIFKETELRSTSTRLTGVVFSSTKMYGKYKVQLNHTISSLNSSLMYVNFIFFT